jgi:glycosyltransferase involved in cell wall biosynthesis
MGIDIELYIPKNTKPNFTVHSLCKVINIPLLFPHSYLGDFIYQVYIFFFFIFSIVKNGKPDLIYARQNYSGILPIFFARLFAVPYFAEVNSIVNQSTNKVINLKTILKKFMEHKCLRFSNLIITPSETLNQRIFSRYKLPLSKIYAVPNGFNERVFYPKSTNLLDISQFNTIGPENTVVGFVGSMGEWQGINVFKQSILELSSDITTEKIIYLLVGDYVKNMKDMLNPQLNTGSVKDDIQSFISDNHLEGKVIYTGRIDYEKSADYINVCDILVAPYTRKSIESGGGSPMKLYAYLGCERPVIISDLGEFTDSEALKKHKAAYLIEPDNPHELAMAIKKLKNDPDLRKEIAVNGKKFVIENRKWFHSAEKIISIYHQKF